MALKRFRKKSVKQNTHLGVGDISKVPYAYSMITCAICKRPQHIGSEPQCPCASKDKFKCFRGYVAGRYFPSLKEARRFSKLVFLENRGVIEELEPQPKFQVKINGVKVCDVKLDFQYRLNGITVVEDTKGAMTPKGKLKQKMLEAYYPDLKLVIL